MSDSNFVEGYLDGRNPDAPAPSANRSHAYRHSFEVGRREIRGEAPVPADAARRRASAAEAKDRAA